MKNPSPVKGMSFYVIMLIVIIAIAMYASQTTVRKQVTVSEVITQIETGKLSKVTVSGYSLVAVPKVVAAGEPKEIKVKISAFWLDQIYTALEKAKASDPAFIYDYIEPVDFSTWINLIFIIIMIGGIALFFWFTYSRQNADGKNAMSFGRSRARLNDPTKNQVTFNDVAGADEEKEELAEVVDFLRNPSKYIELGAKIPKGILLVGAPGTGKTLLAKAVAGEAKVPFYSISGSDFVEMFVGVGASRVRDLFETAKKKSPCIVFIDEIDAVGRHRGAGMGGGHDEREQTLNQLLVEMDGFGPNEGVIVMAATNRPDILDPALLRPGRFDRRIMVSRPDIRGREEILKVHARNKPMEESIDLREIAKITPGFTGADLANLLNEAALLAARRASKKIAYEDISEAVFKIMVGPEKKSRIISEKERKLTAYHEAGHAIVLKARSETDKVERVSIIPSGEAGGYTAHKPHEDVYYTTKQNLLIEIMVSLGGRAAEQITFNEISTGASSDLQTCNAIARDMITKYGMSDKLPNLVFATEGEVFLGRDYGHVRDYSDRLASVIDDEIKTIIETAYKEVLELLTDKKDILHNLAETLLVKEKIDGPEFEAVYMGVPYSGDDAVKAEKTRSDAAIARNKAVSDAKQKVTLQPENQPMDQIDPEQNQIDQ
ncbi:MAG: ATP-dependent zinc metalloprotease FtsH [Saccharofermentanales bacterium]